MSKGYRCPYCNLVNASSEQAMHYQVVRYRDDARSGDPELSLIMHKCAACEKISFILHGDGKTWPSPIFFSYPPTSATAFPDYVPFAIRSDYAEACSILNNSPKAAATLARRCLQGMIHDFWGIREKNLNAEITSLRGKVTAVQWEAIDTLRKLGNIGAHMEKDVNNIVDVDPEEAQKLLKLIELFIDKWYVARYDEETLLREISEIGDRKESDRLSNAQSVHVDNSLISS